jgi:hypothetical protein
LRRQQQEQFRALERRQQQVLDGQQREREALRQRQFQQQEVFRDQQRLLEQRQLRQQERLRRQQEELRLEQQLQRRELQQQQQFRQEIRPQRSPQRGVPAGPDIRSAPGWRGQTLQQAPSRQIAPRQSIQLPGRATVQGGAVRSSPGITTGGQGRGLGSFRGGGGMGFGGWGR